MLLTALDHLVLAVHDLDAARDAFMRLGLTLTAPATHGDSATRNSAFFVAAGKDGESYVELLAVAEPEVAARTPRAASLLRTLEAGGGLSSLMFTTADLDAARAALAALPGGVVESRVTRIDGSAICDVIRPNDTVSAGTNFAVLKYAGEPAGRLQRHRDAGYFEHRLALRRLDHVAIVAHDLDGVTRTWTATLGVPVHGEVRAPGMLIRQLEVGDAIVELLAADGAESRIGARPAGLVSVAAFEVANIHEAVAMARAAGFTVPDPAPGPLPGTLTATIPGTELAGLNLQLLQYV